MGIYIIKTKHGRRGRGKGRDREGADERGRR
jgi:hypothetical protein